MSPSPTSVQKNPRVYSPESKQTSPSTDSDEKNSLDSLSSSNISQIQNISSPELHNLDSSNSMATTSINTSIQDLAQESNLPINDQITEGVGQPQEVIVNDPRKFDKYDYLKQRDNRYSETSPPSFIVYIIDTEAGGNLGNLHPIDIGKHLKKSQYFH